MPGVPGVNSNNRTQIFFNQSPLLILSKHFSNDPPEYISTESNFRFQNNIIKMPTKERFINSKAYEWRAFSWFRSECERSCRQWPRSCRPRCWRSPPGTTEVSALSNCSTGKKEEKNFVYFFIITQVRAIFRSLHIYSSLQLPSPLSNLQFFSIWTKLLKFFR